MLAVLSSREAGRGRCTITGNSRGRGDILHDRVVVEPHVWRVIHCNAAAFVRGDVVGDHVVVHVHREVARHQEAQAAAVIVRQVALDQVVVDVNRARALRACGRSVIGERISGQFTGDHDAGAFIIGTVEVDTVVVDAVGNGVNLVLLEAEDADTTAIFRREVTADIVVRNFVIVRAVEEADGACQVGAAVGDNPVIGNPQIVVLVIGIRRGQVGRADADGAIGAAVILDRIIRDLQITSIGIGKDRAALRFNVDHRGGSGVPAEDGSHIAREAHLIAAAKVQAVNRGFIVGGELAVVRQDIDNLAFAYILIAIPGEAGDLGAPGIGQGGVAAKCNAVDDRAIHRGSIRINAARTDTL